MWLFTDVADGLSLAACSRRVAKGAAGFAPRSSTFLQGTHAFSALASFRRAAAAGSDASESSPVENKDESATAEEETTVHFSVSAPSADSSVMVGVAQHGTPLDTPIAWEEDHCYQVECSARGAFLWSERAAAFGVKLSDECWRPAVADNGSTDEAGAVTAAFAVTWGPQHVGFRVIPADGKAAADGAEVRLPRPDVAEVQGRESVAATQPALFPIATLVSPLCSVAVAAPQAE